MNKQQKTFKIRLTNVQTLGARCGYGQGRTQEEAIEDALKEARRSDPNAYYDERSDTVCFRGGVNC